MEEISRAAAFGVDMTPALAAAMLADTSREIARCARALRDSERNAIVEAFRSEPSAAHQAAMMAEILRAMSKSAHDEYVAGTLYDAADTLAQLAKDLAVHETEGYW